MKPSTVVIKKYGNRRLYDTAESRYVNLDEIAGLVRRGKDVQVVDAKTGQDLTRVTLTQIIMGLARHNNGKCKVLRIDREMRRRIHQLAIQFGLELPKVPNCADCKDPQLIVHK